MGTKKMKDLNQNEQLLLIVVIIVGAVMVAPRLRAMRMETGDDGIPGGGLFNLPDIILNIIIPGEEEEGNGDDYQPPPPQPPPENYKYPTSLSCFVQPGSVGYGGWIFGSCTSNGYNFAITIKAVHKGSGEALSIPGFCGSDGKFTSDPYQMKTPGFWEFQVTSENGVKSNVASLTVGGITTGMDPSTLSQTLQTKATLKIYTTLGGVTVNVFVSDHATSTSIPIGSYTMGPFGYYEFEYDFTGWSRGNSYELDAIYGSDYAHNYNTAWFVIGR